MSVSSPPEVPVDNQAKTHQANNFDAIRFFLAIGVIFSHSFGLMNQTDPVSRLSSGIGLGGAAVLGFFLLSGYLITMSWLRSRSPEDYLLRRALRIYPGFIAVCLLCGLLFGPLFSYDRAEYWRQFNPSAFLAHIVTLRLIAMPSLDFFYGKNGLNGSLWTIHEEFICYLIVIILGWSRIFARRSILLALTLFLYCLTLFWSFVCAAIPLHFPAEIGRIVSLLSAFLIGSCCFLYRDRLVFRVRIAAVCLAVTFALLHWGGSYGFLCLPFAAYILFTAAFTPRARLGRFARHGDFSYGLYLYAFPMQIMLLRYFGPYLNGWLLFLFATPLTLVCAVLSWRFIEAPCLRISRRLVKKQ